MSRGGAVNECRFGLLSSFIRLQKDPKLGAIVADLLGYSYYTSTLTLVFKFKETHLFSILVLNIGHQQLNIPEYVECCGGAD